MPIVLLAGLLAGCADDHSTDTFVKEKVVLADQLVRDRYVPEIFVHELPFPTTVDHRFVDVTIVHTANERGAIDSAAMITGLWNRNEPASRLTLSSGDSIAVSPVSTWFRGEPGVDVMNAMGYDAIALGNHELDLGRDQLAAWIAEADFTVLAANVEDDIKGPQLRDEPFEIFQVGHAAIAVIGVAHPDTPELAAGPYYEGVTFHPPTAIVLFAAAIARAQGADAVVVLAHLDTPDLIALAEATSAYVDVILGGNALTQSTQEVDGVLVVESGGEWVGYSHVALTVDTTTHRVIAADAAWQLAVDPMVLPDPTVKNIARAWDEALEMELGDVIAYAGATIARGSWMQANWVTDSWLWALPEADIAIQNAGGLRADVGPGDITRADILSMLSYDNSIIQVDLTGAEVVDLLEGGLDSCGGNCIVAVSGIRYDYGGGGLSVVLDDGRPINAKAVYTVLVNNFMYYGGSGFLVDGPGHDPIFTGLNYRDPVMEWTTVQKSSARVPLDTLIDAAPRNIIE
ncbi:MAG: bifunctional metallophosphatase/5'-nucleotidase [Deltaproteobacteria bacterium]|nr:MAG: bifunctional metallophosphatase/5'-nucleotidase [Deltaproteobacteria bacterium]